MTVESYPLSFPQQAIFLDGILNGPTTKFNMGGGIVIRGPLDGALFRQAIEFAFRQHDVQRMRILARDGEGSQEFVEDAECAFEALDFTARSEPFRAAIDWVLADNRRPSTDSQFPLSSDVLFRLGGELHLWYPKFHHIANDAYGHSLIARTVAEGYNGLLREARLPELEKFSYVDFIRDDRAYADSARFRQDEAFWRGKFASMPEPLPFTARKHILKGDALKTDRWTLGLHRLVYNSILRLCDEAGVTPFQFLLAVLFAYLHRVTGREDLVVGTPILNRSTHAFRRTAGMFMNMMPLRVAVARESTILELARRISAELRACYRHQRFPLGEIVRHCRTVDGFCHGVFDVTLIYRKLDYDLRFGESPVRTVTLDTQARNETLSIEIDEYNEDEDVNFFFNYNPQLIPAEEARLIARTFEAMLIEVAVVGDRPVGELRLISDPVAPAVTRPPDRTEKTVLDLFAERAAEAPDAVAVVDGAAKTTYGTLARLSGQIAGSMLRDYGVEPEQPVAVLCDRNTRWVASILGIMKAGGAYLPLDPGAPRARIEFILKDSGCRLLLADEPYSSQTFPGTRTVRIEEALGTPAVKPGPGPGPRSLAYIIYTSGTTGLPKGVLVEHRGLANTAAEQARGWALGAADGFLQCASPVFDASIAEVFAPLAAGARLVIAPKDVILDPAAFLALLGREKVTAAILTPAYLSALGRIPLPSLRLLGTAGEAANPADVAYYSRSLTFVNAYGPTEASVCAAFLKLEAGTGFSGERVPVGKPLPNTEIYILDEDLRPVPAGAAGEICVGGVNVARGYLNRPELTNERFVPNPFREGERIYRTGDVGRRLPDGDIEFLGRRDTQVKIRGYRVELGEVEALLQTHPEIETAAVIQTTEGELAAYVVRRGTGDSGDLRRFLALKLPAYMIPSRWIRMDALPLNSAGKVDRGALPAAPAAPEERAGADLPVTAVEKAVAAIWEDVLGGGPVGRTSDFFELGGHSLKAVGILTRIERTLGAQVDLKTFFAGPTVAQLAAVVQTRGRRQTDPIPPAPPMDAYPLSHAQARIWVHSQMEGGAVAYNMPLALDLEGDLDPGSLERALRGLIARHESLRTCFLAVDGTPRQKIVAAGDIRFGLAEEDLRAEESPEEEAGRRLREEVAAPFDLSRAPLLRARLFRLAEGRRLLSLVVHHLVGDGWSLELLLRELTAAYGGRPLEPLPIQYKDYSTWMSRRLKDGAFQEERDFWLARLAAPRPVLNLPSDLPRPTQMGFSGSIERFALPATRLSGFQEFCAARGVSPFMFLLAGVFGLLHRYTGEEDIIIGTPAAGRDRLELEDQVGLYLNTLALRVRVDRGVTLATLLDRVRTAVLEGQQHQTYPFDRLVGDLKPERRTDRNPLFDVMVVMHNPMSSALRIDGIRVSDHAIPAEASVFDLTFHFALDGPDARLDLEYNTGLFGHDRMERLAGHLDRLLAAMVADPDANLEQVGILADRERDLVLREFAEGPGRAIPEATVIDLFAEQAARTPDRTAVVFEGRRLSYGDVAAAASQLAADIGKVGPGRGTVVALVAGRSERMVAGVAGIMASGAACLPIDAALPGERIRYLLEDSGCEAVVSDGSTAIDAALPVIVLPDKASAPGGRQLAGAARGSDIAYITYTSGSTGAPKGSLIEHRSLTNLVTALDRALYGALPNPATELLLTSLSFDVAMKQIFGALTRGNAVEIAGDLLRRDPKALMSAIADHRIQLIDVTPAHFSVLLAQGFARLPKPDLKAIVLGSESLPYGLVETFSQEPANRHIALFNFYGPSECTVETLYCRLESTGRGNNGVAPLGRPLENTRAYVLSAELSPVPIGVPGEICLGGIPVGRGYLNRPDLDAAKFVEDPFRPGERIYRTGDLGRWTAGGQMEFLGRADDQLKVRGHRIEPGEVEHCLLRHPQVTGAAVAARTSPAGTTELAAWYTAADPAPGPDSLRAHLRRFLPDSLVPARIVAVRELALRANGKIDKDALPDPWARTSAVPAEDHPEDSLEAEIHAMWRKALGVENPGLDVGFFDAGGNSLLLTGLHSLIEERHPGVVKLIELFSAATVRDQARLIRERTAPAAAADAPAGARNDFRSGDPRVAIIGIGLRIGDREDLDSLWEDLESGRDFIRPMPESRRLEAQRIAAALGIPSDQVQAPQLAYLDEIDKFDFAHFHLAPQKASLLDPREKIFLETAWHAIEDAGYGGGRLKHTRTGVFLGESGGSAEFHRILEAAGTTDANQMLESLTPSIAASRISYLLDLKGPAMLADTACSSALSAVFLAMEALRNGRCDMALAGAVKLHLLPFRRAGRTEIESPDWRTHAFDEDAAGTGGGEAGIALMLKPLARALADGDPIHAVLRGAAANQDGASNGITAPNAEAQADVIEEAWKDAGIHPDSLSFIEAHGTGTRLGDPVEVEGLTRAFRRYTARTQFCALGSVKANLGHTDHAAGLAGLLRAVLCLKHRRVAPAIHYSRPNHLIRFEESPLFVNSAPAPLERKGAPLAGGVSSFGLSGTNVHVVVEEAPESETVGGSPRSFLVPLSARTNELLRRQAERLRHFIGRHPELSLDRIALTLATGRDHLGARAAILCESIPQLLDGLAALNEAAGNRLGPGVVAGFHKMVPEGRPALLEHEATAETLRGLSAQANALAGAADAGPLAELAGLYVAGAEIPWESLFHPSRPRRCGLPGYPFERTRSWPEVPTAAFSLLGDLKAETPDGAIFEADWRQESHWLLGDHRIDGAAVLAGSAYLELARLAAKRIWDVERVEIAQLGLLAPLVIPAGETVRVATNVVREEQNLRLSVHSYARSRGWQTHARARLARLEDTPARLEDTRARLENSPARLEDTPARLEDTPARLEDTPARLEDTPARLENSPARLEDTREGFDPARLRAECSEEVAIGPAGGSIHAGPRWNCLRAVRRGAGLWMAELGVPADHASDAAEFGLYPPLLDVALNFAAGSGGQLPLWFGKVCIYGRLPQDAIARARVLESSAAAPHFEVAVADPDGRIVVSVGDYVLKERSGPARLDRFFHQVRWVAAPVSLPDSAERDALVIAAGCGCEEDRRIADSLGARFVAHTDDEWRGWLAGQNPGACVKAVLLLPTCTSVQKADLASLDARINAGLGRQFALSTVLAERRGSARLLVAGRLAHEVTGEEESLYPLNAAAAGFARVPQLETADFQCRFLDLDSGYRWESILQEFPAAFAADDTVAARRGGERYVPRIQPVEPGMAPEGSFDVREGATYLITGGCGGIGLEIARYLASRAKVTLILANRRMFPPRVAWERLEQAGRDPALAQKIRRLLEIEGAGSTVHLAVADAASSEDLTRLKREFPAVRGIFHCAGVGRDVYLARHEWPRFNETLRPKTHGTLALYEVFGGEDLDAFVLAGSLTAFTGAPGQAGYAAASAFEDVEARRLRRLGVPAQCLNWTAWKDTGMAAESGRAADDVFRAIATSDALLCLDRALRTGLPHLVVGEASEAAEPAAPRPTAADPPRPGSSRAVLVGRPSGRYTPTERLLAEIWAGALGHTEMDIFADFESLGGDSIANLSILERIQSETPFQATIPDLVGNPTIESQAACLDRQQFFGSVAAGAPKEELVRLGFGAGSRKIFCFAPASGTCYRYYELARLLPDWDMSGVNFTPAARPPANIADMLIRAQPEGEYLLLGYSAGGNLAYDTAIELQARGRRVAGIVLIDSWRRLEPFHCTDEEFRANSEETLSAMDPRYVAAGNREEMLQRIEGYDRYLATRIEDRKLPCPIRLIRAGVATGPKCAFRISQEAWGDLTGDFTAVTGEGPHVLMLDPPHVAKNAALAAGFLKELAEAGVTAECEETAAS